MKHIPQNKQQGVAAVFIVLFFALLIGIITLSFITIVGQNQEQSINNDLSQSAYDSAQAGVEDGKRLLAVYQACPDQFCKNNFEQKSFVNQTTKQDNTCYSIYNERDKISVQPGGKAPEIKVSRGGNDDKLNQAYSCVSIATETPDFLYTQAANKVDLLVPLRTIKGKTATSVDISWFDKRRDTSDSLKPLTFYNSYPALPKSASYWGEKTPPLLRVQLIKVAKSSISLDDIDKDSKAAFLYPSSSGASSVNLSDFDIGRNSPKVSQPVKVQCSDSVPYACKVNITDNIDTSKADYYLRLIPIYNKTSYQVQMKNGSDVVYFNNVQPLIDSTGRASNLFRRTATRVTYDSEMVNTLGGFDSTQSICKGYSIAALEEDYSQDTGCAP